MRNRPWEMVVVVYGFPSKVAALQFEWAWQKPHRSRHLREQGFTGKNKERYLKEKLRILSIMLKVDHYKRWPLNVHFTAQHVYSIFSEFEAVLSHVKITTGPLKGLIGLAKEESVVVNNVGDSCECCICLDEVDIDELDEWISCPHTNCPMISHLVCLASAFLDADMKQGTRALLPVTGNCPWCNQELKWGTLIQQMKYRILNDTNHNSQRLNSPVKSVAKETTRQEDIRLSSDDGLRYDDFVFESQISYQED